MAKSSSQTAFLNVDLDIGSRSGVGKVVSAMQPAVAALHLSEMAATLELAVEPKSLEEAIVRLSNAVESLEPDARSAWEKCEIRNFNVGIQAGSEPRHSEYDLSNDSILRVARLGAALKITVYAEPKVQHD